MHSDGGFGSNKNVLRIVIVEVPCLYGKQLVLTVCGRGQAFLCLFLLAKGYWVGELYDVDDMIGGLVNPRASCRKGVCWGSAYFD